GISEDEFYKEWAYEHGPLATEWLQRSGIVKYVPYHTTSEHKALGKKMFEATGRSPLSCDGMVEFWVRKYEDYEAAFKDPFYLNAIKADEKKLVCPDTISVTIGAEYVLIEDGK
ncbi:hypothetical protein P171DRAFT_342588, partial [Karstenula rhodostoma CBS 690.94]